MKIIFNLCKYGCALLLMTLIAGCTNQKIGAKSSVVDYLYPKESAVIIEPSIPLLKLPIKLGIAFVPEQSTSRHGSNFFGNNADFSGSLIETKKNQILSKVSSHFKKYPFIGEIQEIPSNYLTSGGSFTNLEQIKTMYGVDVIALISYDQVQFTDTSFLSISYWTIVGAYIVSGEKNDTNTLMDTVVYDISSKKMLFRAPGTSIIKGRSAPINLNEELRTDSATSFAAAANNMIENLDIQLARFREKAKENPEQIKIIKNESYSGGGGGACDFSTLSLLMLSFCFGIKKTIRNGNDA